MEQLRNIAKEGLCWQEFGKGAWCFISLATVIHVEHSCCIASAPQAAFHIDGQIPYLSEQTGLGMDSVLSAC